MKARPLARQASLIVKEVDGETLIYDKKTDKAHCLNTTAGRVWKYCDGSTSVEEIAQRVGADTKTAVDENVVWLALDQLEKFQLLEQPVEKPNVFLSGVSRRNAIRAMGVAAIVLPMVSTIVVPAAAGSTSLLPLGACCHNPNDCASGCCDTTPNPCDCTQPGSDPCGPPDKACKPLGTQFGNPVCQPA